MRIVQSGKGRTYIQWEKLSRRLSFLWEVVREWDNEGWKRLGGWMVEGMKAERDW